MGYPRTVLALGTAVTLAALALRAPVTAQEAGPPPAPAAPAPPPGEASVTLDVTHTLALTDVPAGARRARVWFWIPEDDAHQRVLDLRITDAPAGARVVREGRHGHALLYAEFDAPATNPPRLATEFRLRRDRVSLRPDPAAALPLTDAHRRIFAAELAPDVPYMTVDDTIRRLADEACGGETNVVRQARAIYDRVVDSADHYSRGENAPKPSPDGSAAYCIEAGGGSCTDMHALFIAMCRARGIPTRLHFGSRVPADREGKDVDTGYRCWAEFFAPGIGWVPVDVAAGDTVANGRDFYFGGLDERRIRFMEGRDLLLDPAPAGPRPNLVIRAHVEIDGVPHTGIRRTIHYRTVR